jgi:hypothetical protein
MVAMTVVAIGLLARLGGNAGQSAQHRPVVRARSARYVTVDHIAASGSKVYVGGSFCSSIG